MIKKQVIFLCRRFLPHIGGVEFHIEQLCKELKEDNYDISIITEQDDLGEPLSEVISNVKVVRIPHSINVESKLTIWRWTLRYLWMNRALEILHIHDVFYWILPFYPILKLFNKKIFITFHGYEGNNNPAKIQIFWHKLASLLTDGNICIGGFHEKWYRVYPSYVSFGAVEVNKSPRIKNNDGVSKVIFAGRLSDDTGIMHYLKAVKVLSRSNKVHIDIYGDGPLRNTAVNYCIKFKLPVSFFGFVNHADIQWGAYDVAFVSRYLAILEAFSAGIPVIAHYNVEIKKDYLLLSPFRNWIKTVHSVNEIVDAYTLLIKAPNHKQIRSAQRWANQQTWNKLALIYQTLWNN